MIVLDTNVVCGAMKPEPHPAVLAWPNDRDAETSFLSSITLAALLFGIRVLPAGKRKAMLTQVQLHADLSWHHATRRRMRLRASRSLILGQRKEFHAWGEKLVFGISPCPNCFPQSRVQFQHGQSFDQRWQAPLALSPTFEFPPPARYNRACMQAMK